MNRPRPPKHLWEPGALKIFEPAPQVVEWLRATFLNERSPFYDEAHAHLLDAHLGVLWTDVVNETKMVPVAGYATMPRPPTSGGKWGRARWEMQQRQFFGHEKLDFEITLYAPYASEADDLEFCSLIKHELSHCAQAVDDYGDPWFRRDGKPVFAIRDHDFAGFLGNVRDFGPGAERNVPELIEIVKAGPRIALVDVSRMCGTCMLRAV